MSEFFSLLPSGGLTRFTWDLVWQSTLVALVALVLLQRVQRPAARAWLIVLATGLCVAIPFFALAARAGGLGFLPSEAAVRPSRSVQKRTPGEPSETLVEPGDPVAWTPTESVETMAPPVTAPAPAARPTTGSQPGSWGRAGMVSLADVARGVGWLAAAIWLLMTFASLTRLGLSALSVWRIQRDASRCGDAQILHSSRLAAEAMGLQCEPDVAVSPQTGCPTVLAWGRPKLFIPPLDQPRSEQHWFSVFSHELAHVKRGDGWSQLWMELVRALLPWHPLIHCLHREHRQACEEACDDWALFVGADPFEFAASLTEWIPVEPKPLALGVGGGASIRKRIERLICGPQPKDPQVGRAWVAGGGAIALASLILLAMLQTATPSPSLAGPLALVLPPSDVASSDHAPRIESTSTDSPAPGVTILGARSFRHWNSAEILGWGADARTLVTCGRDDMLHVWNLDTGTAILSETLPPSALGSRWWNWETARRGQFRVDVKLSPDGETLFLAKADGAIECWDVASMTIRRRLQVAGQPIRKLAISANGRRLAGLRVSGASDRCSALILDVASGEPVGEIEELVPEGLRGTLSAPWRWLQLSPDGTRLAVARNGDASLWDVAGGGKLYEFAGGWNLEFHPDGHSLLSAAPEMNIKLWNAETGAELASLRNFSSGSRFAFHPDGERAAIADGSRLRLVDLRTGKQCWIVNRYNPSRHYSLPSVAFHPDGKRLAATFGHQVRIFAVEDGREHQVTPAITSLAASPAAPQFVIGDEVGNIELKDLHSQQRQAVWHAHQHEVHPLAFSHKGTRIASAAFEHMAVWKTDGTLLQTIHPELPRRGTNPLPPQLAFGLNDEALLVGYRARELRRWDLTRGQWRDDLKLNSELLVYHPIALASSQLVGLSRVSPRGVGVWDTESRKRSRTFPVVGGIPRFATSRDGRRIAVGARGDRIEVWELEGAEPVEILRGHSRHYLRALALSPDGSVLASGAEDGKVRIWNAATGDAIASLRIGPRRGVIDQLAFSHDGRALLSRNGDGTVAILRWTAQTLVRK